MKIELEDIKDREDGGADLTFEMDEEGREKVLNEGVKYILLKTLSGMSDDEIFEVLCSIETGEENTGGAG